MHFWIDKRSQAYGFNGRHGVPASLASGRRNKSIITPLHRFHSIENTTIPQPIRRPNQQHHSHHSPSRMGSRQSSQSQPPPAVSREPVREPLTERPRAQVDVTTCVNVPAAERAAENAPPPAQFMKLGGLTKYGMWVSFGLTTLSIAATKFYSDYQGTFEILLLCTLGLISSGLLISCLLAICKRKPPPHFANIHPVAPQAPAAEIEIPDVLSNRDIVISTIITTDPGALASIDQPPPPYDVAVLYPTKKKDDDYAEYPPPTYENAVR